MNTGKNVILFFFMLISILTSAQNLYIPSNATIRVADGAGVHAGGTIQNNGTIRGEGAGSIGTNQHLDNNGNLSIAAGSLSIDGNLTNNNILGVGTGSELIIGRNMVNDGVFGSAGDIYLGGNWTNNSTTMNLLEANINFTGTSNQQMNNNQLRVKGISMAAVGPVTINSDDVLVTENLDFRSGVLRPGTGTRLILESSADASGGSETSYYDGPLISRGTGFKYFPVGGNGHFGPVEFDNIHGNDPELAVSHIWTNPVDPVPGEDLIGVSSNGLWQVELLAGTFDSSKIFLDFMDEDLENFVEINDIRATYFSPAIAYADRMGGIFNSLGVETLENTDSISYGRILSQHSLVFSDTSSIRYLALAKAPLVPPAGVYYVPEAFSPNASSQANQAFRIFGERISSNDFLLQVYNRKRIMVYETTSFTEANEIGWDGTNQKNGFPEPSGVYYYNLFFYLVPLNGDPDPKKLMGEVYLIR